MKNEYNNNNTCRKRRRLNREGLCEYILQEEDEQDQVAVLANIARDIQRHIKICSAVATNTRQRTLAILRMAKQYKDQQPLLFPSILDIIEAYLPQGSSCCQQQQVFDTVECANSEEKQDEALTRAYALTMEPSVTNMSAAEQLLLSILPDSVGGDVLDFYCMEQSNGCTKYYDVEHSIELVFVRDMLERANTNNTTFVAKAAPVSHHSALHLYVYLLIEKRQYERALQVCQIAIQRNPLFVHCLFESGEIYKMWKQPEQLLQETMNCFARCYKQRDLAKCYRNFGFYFIEKKEFENAMACFLKSLEYECHAMVKNELLYIQHRIPQNDPLYEPISNIVSNLKSAELSSRNQQQQPQQHHYHANTPFGSMATPTVSLPAHIATYVTQVLEKAHIPTTPNPLFLQVSHHVAVSYKSSKRFLEACSVAYGLTQCNSYLAYMRLYLNGVEIAGQKLVRTKRRGSNASSNVYCTMTSAPRDTSDETMDTTFFVQAETCMNGSQSEHNAAAVLCEDEASLRPIPQQEQETKL